MRFSITLILFLFPLFLYSQILGPNSPSNVTDGGGGQIPEPWLNPNNARMQNDVYATIVTSTKNKRTNYLSVQNFGFNIPSGSTITGILVEVNRHAVVAGGSVHDGRVRIIDATGAIGTVDKASLIPWPPIDLNNYESYGGITDTWALLDWTASKINNPNFGVAIMGETSNDNTTFNLFIDHVQITVYYITGGAARYAVASGNWSNSASWSLSPGGAPGASPPSVVNDVFIGGGHTITNDVTPDCNSLTIGTTEPIPTGTLAFAANNNDLTVHAGGLLITTDGDITGTQTPIIDCLGDLTLNKVLTNRDFIMRMGAEGTGRSVISGTGSLGNLFVPIFVVHTGNITITESLLGNSFRLINSSTGHLTYTGPSNFTGTLILDLTEPGNTVEYAHTILNAADFDIHKLSITYYNLIISGNAPKYYNGPVTVLEDLTISSTGILSNQQSTGLTLEGNWTNNNGAVGFVPNACNACTVIFQGTNAQTIANAAGEQFHRIEVNKTLSTLSANNNIIIDNQLLMTSGDFDMGPNSLTGTANTVFNGGELLIGTTGTIVPALTGTYTLNGGTITFNGAGNQTIRSATSTPAITAYRTVRFAGSGTKALSGAISVNNGLSITGTAILDVTASNFGIALTGHWTNASSFLARTGTVTLNGTSAQIITNSAGETFNNLIINNSTPSSAIVLNGPALVNGLLTFTDGHILTTSVNLLTLAAGATVVAVKDDSHVAGPVGKVTTSTALFSFPIGDGTNYMPAGVTPTSTAATTFVAEYFPLEPVAGTLQSGIDHVSSQNFWDIQRISGTANAAITLMWEYPSAGDAEINNVNDLLVAQWDGVDWINQGNASTTGNFVSGSVTSNPVSSFITYHFVLGSTSALNPLSNYRYFSPASNVGNWNDPGVWAFRPGGPTTASEPSANKLVIISPGKTVTILDSPTAQATKAMKLLVVFGTIIFADAAGQDITVEVGESGFRLGINGNIMGTDPGDEIRMSGNVTLNNTAPISHTVLETNFVTIGNTITGDVGSLPILRITQNSQIFTGTTSYNTLAVANSATNNGTITINNSLSGGGILTNAATGTIIFQGTTATGNVINAGAPGNLIRLVNNTGSTINIYNAVTSGIFGNLTLAGISGFIQSQDVDINGNLIIEAGASLNNGSSNRKLNIGGNWTNNNGALGFLNGTNDITFDGSTPQSIFTSSGKEVFNNLVINNTSSTGVTLSQGEVHVTNDLVLTDGIVFTDAVNLLVLEDNATSDVGSAATFVDGPMKKIGNEAFVFPVGDGATWARLGLETIAGFDVTTEFTCQYLHIPYSDRTSLDPSVAGVSNIEHWLLNRVLDPGNNANSLVRLYWENETVSGITDKADLRVGHYYNAGSGLKWYNSGSVITDNGNGTGSVLSTTTFTSFGPVTFVSEFGFALPIKLTRFTAEAVNNTVAISWRTASELYNDYFTVQRSVEGIEFESLFKVTGAGISTVAKSYEAVDPSPYRGVSYYRLKQTDYDGKSTFSKIVAVNVPDNDWVIFPNPSNGSTIQLLVPKEYALKALTVTVTDVRGLVVQEQIVEVDQQGRMELLSGSQLANGIYFIRIKDGYLSKTMRLIISR